MITLKFGGTSMGSAHDIVRSVRIISERAAHESTSVVVSAAAGVSNHLQAAISSCTAGSQIESFSAELRQRHRSICMELGDLLPQFCVDTLLTRLEPLFEECDQLLSAVAAMGECPASAYCRIMGLGERLSAPITEEALRASGQNVELLDSRSFIFTTGSRIEGEADYEKTAEALALYREASLQTPRRILLFAGFICSWQDGGPGLLGRNGSDFSAAIIARALAARKVEFWSDVDGIYTADPRIVEDAILIDNMSYEEAMELSFFGSKVLHPKTLSPLAAKGIEAWSLNSKNPASRGTRIAQGPFEKKIGSGPVCGISCLKHTSLISVSGPGMKGRRGMAERIFGAVSRAEASILLITQSSSEYTVSFCLRRQDTDSALSMLEKEFELELREKLINPIDVEKDCAIVSIVGDRMKQACGTAGTFFDALASRSINILAIAQGSSERSISAVISGENGDTAVRIAHRFFFNTAQTIELFIFGAGSIGSHLIDQIRERKADLASQHIEIKIMSLAASRTMLLKEEGISLESWHEDLRSSQTKTSVDEVLDFVQRTRPLNPVFVDCTASYEVSERYLDVLSAGMHIATPNKRANSMSMEYYRSLRRTANAMHRRFLYETNVGAGLPVIDTLQNLIKSGDRLSSFSGIMSGSLSYIFGRLDEGVAFSQAVREARDRQFTEPDPRDDLAGLDVARKALIIAREAGFFLELEDVRIEPVFPPDFDSSGSIEEFMERLPQTDDWFFKRMETVKKAGRVLRMAASIEGGSCRVSLLEVGAEHPLFAIKGGENAFVFNTNRYSPIPLAVRGYGAGAAVTAAGVFADILRTVSWNPEAL